MVSSHILPELADVCNKVGMIEKGVLLVSANVPDVMRLVRPRTVLQIGVQGDLERPARSWSRASSWRRSRSAPATCWSRSAKA